MCDKTQRVLPAREFYSSLNNQNFTGVPLYRHDWPINCFYNWTQTQGQLNLCGLNHTIALCIVWLAPTLRLWGVAGCTVRAHVNLYQQVHAYEAQRTLSLEAEGNSQICLWAKPNSLLPILELSVQASDSPCKEKMAHCGGQGVCQITQTHWNLQASEVTAADWRQAAAHTRARFDCHVGCFPKCRAPSLKACYRLGRRYSSKSRTSSDDSDSETSGL